MRSAGIIRKAHRDLQVRVRLVVQPVNAALPEKGKSCDSKRNGVRQTGFAAAIAAGHNGRIAERELHRSFIAFEAGDNHAADLKAFDFFHSSSLRCLLHDLIAVQRIKCDVSLFAHCDLRVIELRAGHEHRMTALRIDLRLLAFCVLQHGADQRLTGHILLIAHRQHNVLADLPRRKRKWLLRLLCWPR